MGVQPGPTPDVEQEDLSLCSVATQTAQCCPCVAQLSCPLTSAGLHLLTGLSDVREPTESMRQLPCVTGLLHSIPPIQLLSGKCNTDIYPFMLLTG